jgi:hypothetical protein
MRVNKTRCAKRFKVEVSPDVERFFNAVAAGDWDELNTAFLTLKNLRDSGQSEEMNSLWGPILETLLIAECAHDWPAQKLLDYGQAILDSLKPGMVYVGGTDPGRGIPTLGIHPGYRGSGGRLLENHYTGPALGSHDTGRLGSSQGLR